MRLFGGRRKRAEATARRVIWDHPWVDPVLDAAMAELRDGHLRAATTVLAEAREDPELRDLRLSVLVRPLIGHTAELAELADHTNDPELALLAGAGHVAEAATIRGATPLTEPRARLVRASSAASLPHLATVAEALPDDPMPWRLTMTAGRLGGAGRDQQDRAWREVSSRAPTLWSANQDRIRDLSRPELLDFATAVTAAAPPGDPVVAVVPTAAFELYRHDRGLAAKLTGVLQQAADRWLGTRPTPHPRTIATHNAFAAAFAVTGAGNRVLPHLVGMRDRLTEEPWAHLDGDDPGATFRTLVHRYWPPDLVVTPEPEPWDLPAR